MITVEVLIISDKYDFTTDFVCRLLEKKEANYLRINRDEFTTYNIYMDTNSFHINVKMNGKDYIISEKTLKSIYFRAPIFLRDQSDERLLLEEQLYREQWMAFVKNLLIFENVIWMNSPDKTYRAENKILQLKYAKNLGFLIPKTIITNTVPTLVDDKYIVKSLDTAFFNIDGKEGFVYSNLLEKDEIEASDLKLAPVIIQEYIAPKTDIRVTVIENKVFVTNITQNNKGIDIDWRIVKDDVEFSNGNLPSDIEEKCVALVQKFGLKFGAIDLLKTSDNKYVFLEINPTGEWAWLVHTTGQLIPHYIAETLIES